MNKIRGKRAEYYIPLCDDFKWNSAFSKWLKEYNKNNPNIKPIGIIIAFGTGGENISVLKLLKDG